MKILKMGVLALALMALPIQAVAASQPKAVRLVRMVVRIPDGTVWATEGMAGFCGATVYELKWNAGQSEFRIERAAAIFNEELGTAGLSTAESTSLFGDEPTNNLEIGVVVTAMKARLCGFADEADNRSVAGTMTMSAEWQVYDPVRREVIAKIQTSAMGEEKKRSLDGPERVFIAALRANARVLLADSAFRNAVTQGDSPVAAAVAAPQSIQLAGAKGPTRIADAVGSVVTIFVGDAFGSGVLISSDGYFLTNQHVVGLAKTARIRWSDGFETTGEIIRSDKRRDVALIKADPHGRLPLALNRGAPAPGTTVFAIGTPLDPKLQSSVTRGVVSGNRIVDGFNFIQSDTPVTHGNSGGPLLDEQGAVVGLTDWDVPATEGSSLNFFIPIGDALDFLALKANYP